MRPRIQLVVAAVLFATGGAAIKAVEFSGLQVASPGSGLRPELCSFPLTVPGEMQGPWPIVGAALILVASTLRVLGERRGNRTLDPPAAAA
ncbi:MAG: hypothetical protein SGI84_14400 [Gemmatimonadota bacterium]|nr:hypothetical protein [Gemmatimonadota bacterium]